MFLGLGKEAQGSFPEQRLAIELFLHLFQCGIHTNIYACLRM